MSSDMVFVCGDDRVIMWFTNDSLVRMHQVLTPLVASMAESLVSQLKLFLGSRQIVIGVQDPIVGV
jgi:hypothetical protein